MIATAPAVIRRCSLVVAVAVLAWCPLATDSWAQASDRAGPNFPGRALTPPSTPEEIEAARPNPQAPGFRIPLPPLDEMTPADRAFYEDNSRTFHTPVGPRAAWMVVRPDAAAAFDQFGASLRKSTIPSDIFELAIIMTGADWRAELEWWIHAPQAVKAGIPAEAVEAIRLGRTPRFDTPLQEAAYNYLKELLGPQRRVSDPTYERLRALLGTSRLVELTVLAGYYTIVSMNLVAHGVPLRADVPPAFPEPRR